MYQIDRADIVLSKNSVKHLLIEAKRPGALSPHKANLSNALSQARGYADRQTVKSIAVTDGRYFYAADIENGGLKDRLLIDLSHDTPPEALWWVSVHGIYRPREEGINDLTNIGITSSQQDQATEFLLHPKYQLPAQCFAYVGNNNNTSSWKLPYLLINGQPDSKRLPKAIQAIISNYRGTKVSGIPEKAMPDVLLRLAHAANTEGKLPPNAINPAPVYQHLVLILEQLGINILY